MKVLLTTLTTAAALVALTVPTATASMRPDDRAGARGPGALWVDPSIAGVLDASADELWLDPSIRGAIATASTGDLWLDPAIAEVVRTASSTPVRPDDRGGRREVPLSAPQTTPAGSAGSFDWSDAGIGAGAAGLVALALLGIVLGRHGRRELEHA